MPLYFLALIPFFLPIYGFSQTGEIPFQGPKNIIEYKQAGNTYTWQPVTGETPRPAQPYRPDLSGGKVSDVEPQIKFEARLPYEHKGGDSARVNVRATVDPAKVAAKAKDAIKSGLSGLATGGGYLAIASITCTLLCDAAIEALKDWGVDNLLPQDDGSYHLQVPGDFPESDGLIYCVSTYTNWYDMECHNSSSAKYYSKQEAINHNLNLCRSAGHPGCYIDGDVVKYENIPSYIPGYRLKTKVSDCPSGSFITADGCSAQAPSGSAPFYDYVYGKYTGEGWSHHWAKMTAEAVKNGANVFTDGTSVSISGPSIVPLSTTQSTSPVNLVPGTNTPAPIGHTGPTDSGTKTETTTTQAKNTYSGNQQTVSTQTTTTTNITNNITNNTTTNITNQTETDLPPEKESEDICDKNPDSLACAELDTPEGEIPRDTIEITFQPDDLGLGSGTCPADRQIGPHTFSYAATCSTLSTYVYPLVIALSMFGALLIIFVGKTDA